MKAQERIAYAMRDEGFTDEELTDKVIALSFKAASHNLPYPWWRKHKIEMLSLEEGADQTAMENLALYLAGGMIAALKQDPEADIGRVAYDLFFEYAEQVRRQVHPGGNNPDGTLFLVNNLPQQLSETEYQVRTRFELHGAEPSDIMHMIENYATWSTVKDQEEREVGQFDDPRVQQLWDEADETDRIILEAIALGGTLRQGYELAGGWHNSYEMRKRVKNMREKAANL